MALQVNYCDYESSRPVACDCGWSGVAAGGSHGFSFGLFEVSCLFCGRLLLVVPYSPQERQKGTSPSCLEMTPEQAQGSELAVTERRPLEEIAEIAGVDDPLEIRNWAAVVQRGYQDFDQREEHGGYPTSPEYRKRVGQVLRDYDEDAAEGLEKLYPKSFLDGSWLD